MLRRAASCYVVRLDGASSVSPPAASVFTPLTWRNLCNFVQLSFEKGDCERRDGDGEGPEGRWQPDLQYVP